MKEIKLCIGPTSNTTFPEVVKDMKELIEDHTSFVHLAQEEG